MSRLSIFQKRGMIIVFCAVILYVAIFFYSDFGKISSSFKNLYLGYLPIILLLVILSNFFKSERQKILFRFAGMPLRSKDSFIIFTAGQSMLVTPGGVGSLIKSHFLRKRFGYPISMTAPIILLERYLDMVGILSIITTFFFLSKVSSFFPFIVATDVVIIIMYFIIRNKNLVIKISKMSRKIPLIQRSAEGIVDVHSVILKLTVPKKFIATSFFSIFCWMIDATIVYLCFISIGLNYNFFETTQISFPPYVLGFVTLLPGGLGVTEISMLGVLLQHNISLEKSSVLVLFTRFCTIWFSTILGLIFTKIASNSR